MGVDREKPKTIAITSTAHAKFARACEGRAVGRSMVDAASRLVEWFCRQSDPVQTAVLTDVDKGMESHYAAALELLAAELRSGRPGDDPTSKEKPVGAKARRKLRIGDTSGRVFEV